MFDVAVLICENTDVLTADDERPIVLVTNSQGGVLGCLALVELSAALLILIFFGVLLCVSFAYVLVCGAPF